MNKFVHGVLLLLLQFNLFAQENSDSYRLAPGKLYQLYINQQFKGFLTSMSDSTVVSSAAREKFGSMKGTPTFCNTIDVVGIKPGHSGRTVLLSTIAGTVVGAAIGLAMAPKEKSTSWQLGPSGRDMAGFGGGVLGTLVGVGVGALIISSHKFRVNRNCSSYSRIQRKLMSPL